METIFLSSTARDLGKYRDSVAARLNSRSFFRCVRHEESGPQSSTALAHCRKLLGEADTYVGIIGLRRGLEPVGDNNKRSITQMEYDWACELGKPRLVWMTPDTFEVQGHLRETDEQFERQQNFRSNLRNGGQLVVSTNGFSTPEMMALEIENRLLAERLAERLLDTSKSFLASEKAAISRDYVQEPVMAALDALGGDLSIDLAELAAAPGNLDLAELEGKLKATASALELEARAHDDASAASRIRSAAYWRHVGALGFLHDTQRAIEAYQHAVELDPDHPDGLCHLGELQFRTGDLADAERAFTRLRDVGERSGDKRILSMGWLRLAWIDDRRGGYVTAEQQATTALSIAEELGWEKGIARAKGYLGMVLRFRGDLSRAETMCKDALVLADRLKFVEGKAIITGNLGAIHQQRDQLKEAEQLFLEAIQLNSELGRSSGIAIQYGRLGEIYMKQGNVDRCDAMHSEALRIHLRLGNKEGTAIDRANLGLVRCEQGRFDDARSELAISRELFAALDHREGIARVTAYQARLARVRGDLPEAHRLLGEAKRLCKELRLDWLLIEAERLFNR